MRIANALRRAPMVSTLVPFIIIIIVTLNYTIMRFFKNVQINVQNNGSVNVYNNYIINIIKLCQNYYYHKN